MDKTLVAVASSDGIVVNNHFGKASKFYIYSIDDDDVSFKEIRNLTPVCEAGNHDEEKLESNLKALSDCEYLLVSKIGFGAQSKAEAFGIEAFEIPGIIEASIEQMIKYIKIKELFK